MTYAFYFVQTLNSDKFRLNCFRNNILHNWGERRRESIGKKYLLKAGSIFNHFLSPSSTFFGKKGANFALEP